jgi:uncharacterized protein
MVPVPLLIAASVGPGLAAVLYFIAFAGHPLAAPTYAATKVAMLLAPILALRSTPRADPRTPAVARTSASLFAGIVIGVLSASVLLVVGRGVLWPELLAAAPAIAAKCRDFHIADRYFVAAVLISTVHSAFEEYYWRWFVFGQWRRRRPGIGAHAVAGTAFALHHVVIVGVYLGPLFGIIGGCVVGLTGMLWSALYARTGTLIGGWIAHACCDAALMLLGWWALVAAG